MNYREPLTKNEIREHAAHYENSNPAVYCGTYAKYNNGSLYGMWIDLSTFENYHDFMEFCNLHSLLFVVFTALCLFFGTVFAAHEPVSSGFCCKSWGCHIPFRLMSLPVFFPLMNIVYNIDCPKKRTALDLTERFLSEIFEPSDSLVTVAFLIAPFISCILLSKQKDHLERWSEISYFYTHSLAHKVPTHPFVTVIGVCYFLFGP